MATSAESVVRYVYNVNLLRALSTHSVCRSRIVHCSQSLPSSWRSQQINKKTQRLSCQRQIN